MVPRQYALVKFECNDDFWDTYPFTKNDTYVYMGEIPNMPGHCVVADYKTGNLISGYHIESFKELKDDEC